MLGQITKLKHNVAAETPKKLSYDKGIVAQVLNDLNATKDDQGLSLNIDAAMRGLAPVVREKSFSEIHPKRDPLKPSGSDQRVI